MSYTLVLICLCLRHLVGVSGVEKDEVESTEAMEGDSLTLHPDLAEVQRDDLILWTFGAEDAHIAKVSRGRGEILHDGAEGRFRDRLELDRRSGSLTIRNISTEHAGLYKIDVTSGNKASGKIFRVTVYASLMAPVISSSSPSEGSCVLLCSVGNVSHVTLSWYRGDRLLSSISISELNTSISLHLELNHQDNHTYSCELHNPLRRRAEHLHVSDFCPPEERVHVRTCSTDYGHSFPETVVRLVISVLVGVATVAVLIYDIRSRG